jgi:hypothetical protein
LPQDEQNMEGRFYQRCHHKTMGRAVLKFYEERSTCTAVPYASTSVTPCITSVAS